MGNAVGQILPVLFVTEDTPTTTTVSTTTADGVSSALASGLSGYHNNDSVNHIQGMELLLGVETAICLFFVILVIVYFDSVPPTPPSHSAMMKGNVRTVSFSTIDLQSFYTLVFFSNSS